MNALLITADLMFSSRVASTARQQGVDLQIQTWRQVQTDIERQPQLVFIDLSHLPASELPSLVETLRGSSPGVEVIAYGPHVDESTLHSARTAGCDQVLTRGQFHQQAAELMHPRKTGES